MAARAADVLCHGRRTVRYGTSRFGLRVVRFPRAKIGFLFGIYYVWRWMTVPAYAMFVVWALFQVFLAFEQVTGGTHASAGAHIAGAAIGAIVAWRFRA